MWTFVVCTGVLFLTIYLGFYVFLVLDCVRSRGNFDWFDLIWPLTWPVFAIAYWRNK